MDNPRHQRMMLLAIEQARRAAAMDEVPVGAVVYREDEVLAAACNLRESEADPTAHAEIVALRQAAKRIDRWRLDGCGIAVTLEPCPMCAGALVNSRISEVVYGAADPKMGAVRTLYQLCDEPRFNHRLKIYPGLYEEPCVALLQAFFQARRKGRTTDFADEE